MNEELKQIEDEEGRIRYVYKDSEGFFTVGVGFLVDQRNGGGLDDEEIDWILAHRYSKKKTEVFTRFPWAVNLDRVRLAALVNMAYQLGVPGLAKFVGMLNALKASNWQTAYTEAKDSVWANQTPERAERMAKQLLTGVWQWKQ